MKRDKAILLHYQKAGELKVSKTFYRGHITKLFEWMIQADAVTHDITSKTLVITGKGKTEIVTRQVGIIAGLEELKELLVKNTHLRFKALVTDGSSVAKDTIVAQVSGENSEILAY